MTIQQLKTDHELIYVVAFQDEKNNDNNNNISKNQNQALHSQSLRLFDNNDNLLSLIVVVLLQPNDPREIENSSFNLLKEMQFL